MTRHVSTGSLVFMVLAVGALAWALWPRDEAPPAAGGGMPAFRVPVTVAAVERGRVTEHVTLVGDVKTSRRAELAFERQGRVAEVLVELGDRIEAGAVLARLDDTVLEQELTVALAAAEEARVQAEVAAREAARVRETGADLVSESVLDVRESEAAAARHRLAQNEAIVARIRAQLAQGRLRSPFDAVVTERYVTDGTFTAVGRPAFEVVDLDRRVAHLEIPPPVAATLGDGVSVGLTVDELPGVSVAAELDRIVPAADPATRTFLGLIHLDRRDPDRRLLPGMFVRASIVRRDVEDGLVVPTDAVLDAPGGPVVVTLQSTPDGPLATFVPVTVAARTVARTAVEPRTAGSLSAGDLVVVTGVDNVFPGAPLSPAPRRAAGQADAQAAATEAAAPPVGAAGGDGGPGAPADDQDGGL